MSVNWKIINSKVDVEELLTLSHKQQVVLFKHSTTCPISSMAKMRLEDNWNMPNTPSFYIDVRAGREASNHIADTLGVQHESPQLIIIDKGKSIYDSSHLDINMMEVHENLKDRESS